MAAGTYSLVCCFGMLVSVILFTDSREFSFSPYLLITALMLVLGLLLLMAPETIGKEPQDQIEEVETMMLHHP